MVDTSIIGVLCSDPTELKLRSLTKVSSINTVCMLQLKAWSDYKDKQKFIETPNFGRKLFCRTPCTVSKKSLPLRELNDDLSVE